MLAEYDLKSRYEPKIKSDGAKCWPFEAQCGYYRCQVEASTQDP